MAKKAESVDASPETDVTTEGQEVDIATLGEEELNKLDTEPSSPDDKGAAQAASPDSQDGDKVDDKKETQDGDKPSPGETEIPPETDEVDEFLDEMHALKNESDKDGSDKYSQKLASLKENDPVRYRLWRSESRVKGLQEGYQRARQDRRRSEKEASELKVKQKKAGLDDFNELTEEELEELDREEYAEYKLQKKEIERKRDEAKTSEGNEKLAAIWREYEDFVFDEFGVETEYTPDGKLTEDSIEKMNEAVPLKVRNQIDEELTNLFGKDTVYTAEQIKLVYGHVTRDETLHRERIKAREQVKDGQEAAARGQTSLQKLPSNSSRKTESKKLDDLSIADLDSMGEKEFETFDEKLG